MKRLIPVEKAYISDLDRLTKVLARAFHDDPALNWVLPIDLRRKKALETFFSGILTKLSFPYDARNEQICKL